MQPELWSLYRQMLRCRLFEEAARELWQQGRISGELHLGLGEEAIVAGVLAHLREGDALALDHRSTPPLVARGVDLVRLLGEVIGSPDGLCSGRGGHMHLFSREHLAASSGIVGASAPAAAGFALAGQLLRPKSVAVAFFGEGAMNQGMVMEAMNLAVVWRLPVLFVCKDNDWAITTRSSSVTAGRLVARAAAFDMATRKVAGWKVEEVWSAAARLIRRARRGRGPSFLLAECAHLEGHFLGDPLLRVVRRPVREMRELAGPLARAATAKGASPGGRAASLRSMTGVIARSAVDEKLRRRDPLPRVRARLEKESSSRLADLELEVREEIERALEASGASGERVD